MAAVTLIRPRHPLEGALLPVLGSIRRHGVVELLVVLPDGSKRLIPAAWTDLEQPSDGLDNAASALGAVSDLPHVSVLVSKLSARVAGQREQAAWKSPCKEDDHAACATQSDARAAPGATRSAHRSPAQAGGGGGDDVAGSPDRQDGRNDDRGGGIGGRR
jgi:hypothetical protein